jgi:hypothetical protein
LPKANKIDENLFQSPQNDDRLVNLDDTGLDASKLGAKGETERGTVKQGDESPGLPTLEDFTPVPIRRVYHSHLIFGCGSVHLPCSFSRALLVCGALISEMTMIGIGYWISQDVSESYTSEDTIEDLQLGRDFPIACAVVLTTLFLTSTFSIAHIRIPTIGYIASITYIGICGVLTLYMSATFNRNWSILWMGTFLAASVLELLVSQTAMMFLVSALHLKNNLKLFAP